MTIFRLIDNFTNMKVSKNDKTKDIKARRKNSLWSTEIKKVMLVLSQALYSLPEYEVVLGVPERYPKVPC